MKFFVENAKQAYKLDRVIYYSKYSVLITARPYPGDQTYHDICIYYEEDK